MLTRLWGLPILVSLSLAQDTPPPVVDLGYAKYQGFYDSTYDQNIFRGIRYAAPPVGDLRWQMPQSPAINRTVVLSAENYASQCPQSPNSPNAPSPSPSGDEDCLFLNVMAPANQTKLPVLVWIHGGGYGAGNSFVEFEEQIRTNGNSYLVVSIAYRLGAFGFLSSADIKDFGVVNAGIHDMRFALQWVKKNIQHFGGDPNRVTISGESAGGGSVMMLAMANDGTEGDALFQGLIASSPYLPTQWGFDDAWPTLSYQAFVKQAGCSDAEVPFECLQSVDTVALQNASAIVSASADFGQWAFIPVTDGKLIRKRPTEQLAINKKVNGLRILTGNNENEGPGFTPQNITTEDAFISFILTNYPRLSEQNITSILELYAVPDQVVNINADSNGVTPPFSTTNSNFGVGWQQAANNLYAETTFVCPSYWMADAFAGTRGKSSWKYQFSVPISRHGADVTPLLADPKTPGTGMDQVFRTAFQQTWGNFVVKGDPTLSPTQVDTAGQGAIAAASTRNWRQWGGRPGRDFLLNINMTGGMPTASQLSVGGKVLNLTSYVPSTDGSYPELRTAFTSASGWSWEGGRGKRCQLWVDLGPWAME
ncbi:carboxylesterase family protein [Nemania sp. FL0031]|nr:carboxylesterase family protein [Nemania sp. FL0031]